MPSFQTLSSLPSPIPPGTYVAKVISATERVSEAGNELIAMRLALPDGRTINSCLTFVENARPVINAFCDSAQLLKPADPNIEVELRAEHCRGRYLYISITVDPESNGEAPPKVSRFLSRETAFSINPGLSKVALQPQEPLPLPVVPKTQNLFK